MATMRALMQIITEIERGFEMDDQPEWDRVQGATFDPRQADLFPDDLHDYDPQGQFDGYDVAVFNGEIKQHDDLRYVLFRAGAPIAYIDLAYYQDTDNSFQVKAIRIAPSDQGKNLAPRFYRWLLTDGAIDRLYADDVQTDGGAKIWERLLRQPGIGVYLTRDDGTASSAARRIKTVRGLAKVWDRSGYALYAEALG
jgi:hypothetical protein